ncbi:MAG TPA: hypothetical protein ENK17_03075 [Anaerolineae bacterium]|nr:hypothetical protein [Anaerolineae bacterium]
MKPMSAEWHAGVLARLRAAGPYCRHAAEFIAAHKIRIGLSRQRTGARWTLDGRIELHPATHCLSDPHLLTLIVHEATHLEQGAAYALTVAGELDGWRAQYHAYTEPGLAVADPHWQELVRLPQIPSTADLRRARALMLASAGRGYLIWLLPLRPNPLTRLVGRAQRMAWKEAPRA